MSNTAYAYMLEGAMLGETVFHHGVMRLPGTSIAELEEQLGIHRHDQIDPVIAAHRAEVTSILLAAGYPISESLQLVDITIERARQLAAERVAEEARKKARCLVLRVLLAGGIKTREIDAERLLDLTEQQARQLVAQRRAGATTSECFTLSKGDDDATARIDGLSPPT
jgi:hypothetical protein